MKLLRKLAAVMFYCSLPLWIAFLYSVIAGDEGWLPIGLSIILMGSPAIPQLVIGTIKNAESAIRSFLNPETPFNYAKMIDTGTMKKEIETLKLGEVLALTAVAWLVVPFISILPFIFFGVPPIEAMFESMSGWTSTGLSSLGTVSVLPKSVILFRSITQWIGGLGIVVLILSTTRGREAVSFLKAEGRNQAELSIGSNISMIFNVYFGLTAMGIVLVAASGFGPFDAVNLALSGVSNGGFFPFDDYHMSDFQKIVLAFLMFAGATSFLFFRSVWQGQIIRALSDEEFMLYAGLALSGIMAIVLVGHEEPFNSILNAVSAIAAGGFAIGDIGALHSFAVYVLILLMLCGGMVGSTTGGIKLWRVLVIFKALALQVRETFLPQGAVRVVKINGLPIYERMVVESAIFVFAYVLIFLAAAGAFLAAGYSTNNALFIVASAMGNVGLSTIDVAAMGASGKAFLIVLMYLGRIEIFPSLALVAYFMRE